MDNTEIELYIKTHLDKVFIDFCNFLPIFFVQRFQKQAFIAGGAIYSLWNNIKVNDYDFFIENKDFAFQIIDYFKKNLEEELTLTNFSKGFYKGHEILITSNAISVDSKYQIITRFSGSPLEVASQFDFKHNMFTYKYQDEIKCHSDWNYLKDKKLHFNEERARDLSGIIMRIPKFKDKGFDISKTEIAKILNKLDKKGFDAREREIINNIGTY